MTWTPPRKKPLTKSNTYKKTPSKAKNTYKRQRASAGASQSNMKYVAIAIAGGALLAFLKANGNSHGTEASNLPVLPPAVSNQTVVTRPAPAPTKQKTVYKPAPVTTTAGNYVFVDSFNGEGLYAETSPIYNSLTGNGRRYITKLSNKCYAGQWTGKKQNNMLELYMATSSGNKYNFWIAADEIRIVNKQGYDAAMSSGTGKGKTPAELADIINFFKKK